MNSILFLAYRNLKYQKSRNFLLTLAVAFGFFTITIIDCFSTGLLDNLEKSLSQMMGGTVVISGYQKSSESDTINELIPNVSEIEGLLKENNIEYTRCMEKTTIIGSIIYFGKKFTQSINGIDLTDRNFLNSFKILEGSVENLKASNALIINKSLASKSKLGIGDTVTFSGKNIQGKIDTMELKIAMIINDSQMFSGYQIFAHKKTINDFYGIPEGDCTIIAFTPASEKSDVQLVVKLEEAFEKKGLNVTSRKIENPTNKSVSLYLENQIYSPEFEWENNKYKIQLAEELVPSLSNIYSLLHLITTVVLIIMLAIVMVGLASTFKLILFERIKEIGTLRAMGITGKATGNLFTAEAILLCLSGAVIGLLTAVVCMFVIHQIPVTNEDLSLFVYKERFTFIFSPATLLLQYFLLILLTAFAVRGTAKKASELIPAEALQTVK